MRVLYCHDNVYVRDAQGAVFAQGQFAASFWDPLCETCDAVHVLGRLGAGPPDPCFNRSDRPQVTFDLMPNINTLRGLLFDRADVKRRIDAAVQASDAVILRSMGEITWLALQAARSHAKPVAVEMAGCPWDNAWYHGTLKGRLMAPVRYWRARRAVRAATHVVYVTERFLQERYPASPGAMIAAVSNVRLPDGDDPDAIWERRVAHSALDGMRPMRIGMIGALHHRLKGHDVAIRALARMRRTGPQVILHCLGPGDPAPLRALAQHCGIADRVVFDGMHPSGDPVFKWLEGMDLYIQPSRHEGLPRALIEAMSRGLPCVGAQTGGIPELLPPDSLVSRGDAAQLSDQLDRFLSSRDLRLAQGRANMETARRFASSLLSCKRRAFWSDFARTVRGLDAKNP